MATKKSESIRGYLIDVVQAQSGLAWFAGMWRAELWMDPYDGELCAVTMWVETKRQAQARGRKYFSHLITKPSGD